MYISYIDHMKFHMELVVMVEITRDMMQVHMLQVHRKEVMVKVMDRMQLYTAEFHMKDVVEVHMKDIVYVHRKDMSDKMQV